MLKILIKKLIQAWANIYSHKISRIFDIRLNQLYTLWLLNEFNSVGKNIYFERFIYLIGGKYITIGNNFSCFKRLRLEAIDIHNGHKYTPKIIFGDNVSINFDCHIGCVNRIEIHDNVLIASKVFITDHSHGYIKKEALTEPPSLREVVSKGPVIIEKNVWIGEGVVILGGLKIGENSIVGANSVVTKSVPKNCVVAGNPAKIIKEL